MKRKPGEIIHLDVNIPYEEVLHFLGYPEDHNPREDIVESIRVNIEEAQDLIDCRGLFLDFDIKNSSRFGLKERKADSLAICLVTIGDKLENRIQQYFQKKRPDSALFLDAAGSAAVEEAADQLGKIVSSNKTNQEKNYPCRVSPGYGTWSIEWQTEIFKALPHTSVGVELLPSLLMLPKKSVSFAQWIGSKSGNKTIRNCSNCRMKNCHYRRKSKGS